MADTYKVNLIRESMPPYEEYCDMIKVIWDQKWLTNSGVLHNELESKLKTYLGVDNCLLYTNGHMAIESALQSLKLKGEVITTPFTFLSTTQAIVRSGLVPRFVDIDPKRLTIDPVAIEKAINDKTAAIMGVHVYGMPCDVETISEIADRYGLKVIYDAAHAFGTIYQGKGIGTYGDVSAFSMHATKVFNTAEGGAVTFSNSDYYDNLKNIRNFGFSSKEDANIVGFNAKMSELHAAVGLCNLKYIDSYISKRKHICTLYDEVFSDREDLTILPKIKDLVSNYSYYPIVLNNKAKCSRDSLFSSLDSLGIQTRKYFSPLTSTFSCIKELGYSTKCPIAERVSNNVICLPLHTELNDESVQYVVSAITNLLRVGMDN